MKVLHINSTLGIGGAERLISEMLPLMNKKIEVALLVNQDENNAFSQKLKKEGVTIYSLNSPKIYSPFNIFKLIKWLKEYDIIHVHLFPSLYWVAFANVFCKKPIIYTEHSTYNKRRSKRFMRPIERLIYGKYRRIISISTLTERNLKNWLCVGDADNRFVTINNGINVNDFKAAPKERIYPFTLIMVARFVPAKDQATIIRSLKYLSDDIHLLLVGDGGRMEECKMLSIELGVKERVHFVGIQSDIPSWIGRADVGIQSSFWEGFGLTSVEMMAGGIPVIATDVDGLKQVVEGAGILFPVGDERALANIILDLRYDKEYYQKVASRCRIRAEQYDINNMVESYLKVYNNIIEK